MSLVDLGDFRIVGVGEIHLVVPATRLVLAGEKPFSHFRDVGGIIQEILAIGVAVEPVVDAIEEALAFVASGVEVIFLKDFLGFEEPFVGIVFARSPFLVGVCTVRSFEEAYFAIVVLEDDMAIDAHLLDGKAVIVKP